MLRFLGVHVNVNIETVSMEVAAKQETAGLVKQDTETLIIKQETEDSSQQLTNPGSTRVTVKQTTAEPVINSLVHPTTGTNYSIGGSVHKGRVDEENVVLKQLLSTPIKSGLLYHKAVTPNLFTSVKQENVGSIEQQDESEYLPVQFQSGSADDLSSVCLNTDASKKDLSQCSRKPKGQRSKGMPIHISTIKTEPLDSNVCYESSADSMSALKTGKTECNNSPMFGPSSASDVDEDDADAFTSNKGNSSTSRESLQDKEIKIIPIVHAAIGTARNTGGCICKGVKHCETDSTEVYPVAMYWNKHHSIVSEQVVKSQMQAHAEEEMYSSPDSLAAFAVNYQLNPLIHAATSSVNPPARGGSRKGARDQLTNPTREKRFKCSQCQAGFVSPSSLNIHVRTHTGERPYQCPQCPRAFGQAPGLKRHMLVHTGDKPHRCQQCSSAFALKHQLKDHVKIHMGEKNFKCSVCQAAFTHGNTLKLHMRTHTGDKPFKCPQCPSAFRQSSGLRQHMLCHTGEKPYKCPHCPATFSAPHSLKGHVTIHTGEKPFKCSECPAVFARQTSLRQHSRTHTKEKPFKCKLCPAAFSQSGRVAMHIRSVHTKEKAFSCSTCNASFSTRQHLKSHIKTHTSTSSSSSKSP